MLHNREVACAAVHTSAHSSAAHTLFPRQWLVISDYPAEAFCSPPASHQLPWAREKGGPGPPLGNTRGRRAGGWNQVWPQWPQGKNPEYCILRWVEDFCWATSERAETEGRHRTAEGVGEAGPGKGGRAVRAPCRESTVHRVSPVITLAGGKGHSPAAYCLPRSGWGGRP